MPDTILSPGDKRLKQHKLSTCSFNISDIELLPKSPKTSQDTKTLKCVLSDISLYNEEILKQCQNLCHMHRKACNMYVASVQNYLKIALN